MSHFVGLDVSLDSTSICIVDKAGKVVCEGKAETTPKAIAAFLRDKRRRYLRIGMEAGGLSRWLNVGLTRARLPVVCIEARHASSMLKANRNKTDRNDAYGIAQLMRVGLYIPVHIKTLPSQEIRALLVARQLIQAKFLDIQQCIRGVMRTFGLKLGKTTRDRFVTTVGQHLRRVPTLKATIEALLAVWQAMKEQLDIFNARMRTTAEEDPVCQLLMTAPGVGPYVSLTFRAAMDDPARFRRSRSVGAHFGLAPRVYQSGETERLGRISKFGDIYVRAALYDAATSILRPGTKPSFLQEWGLKIAERRGRMKAKIGVARRLSVVLHRMWVNMEPFHWKGEPAAKLPSLGSGELLGVPSGARGGEIEGGMKGSLATSGKSMIRRPDYL